MPSLLLAFRHRIGYLIGLYVVALASFDGLAVAYCQDPLAGQEAEIDKKSETPALPLVQSLPPATPALDAKQKIRDALSGKATGSTGDAILDGFLEVIQNKDNKLNEPLGSLIDFIPQEGKTGQHRTASRPPKTNPERVYRTAESLLRSARLLRSISGNDPRCQKLIKQMRLEAWRCITPPQNTL